jgi:sugar lactone lactonase YvrE
MTFFVATRRWLKSSLIPTWIVLATAAGFAPGALAQSKPHWSTFGSSGGGAGQFNFAYGVAVDAAGNAWVTDYFAHCLQRRDPSGNWTVVGGQGSSPGQFTGPRGVAIDPSGNLWVSEHGNGRLQRRDPSGNWTTVGEPGSGPGQFSCPSGITFDASGNLWVADTINHRLQMRDGLGNWTVIGIQGTGPGQFDQPHDLKFDLDGNLWVTEWANHRLQRRDTAGNWTIIGSYGSEIGQFNGPVGIDVARDGSIWVADGMNNRLQRLGRNGKWAMFLSKGTGTLHTRSPFGIDFAPDGTLWIADAGNARIAAIDPDQVGGIEKWSTFGSYGTGVGQMIETRSLALDIAGNLWTADDGNSRIQRMDPSGNWTVIATKGSNTGEINAPGMMQIDSAGNLWIADRANHRVQKRDPSGNWSVIGTYGTEPGQFVQPLSVRSEPNGDLWVTDYSDRVQRRRPNGEWTVFGQTGNIPGRFSTPINTWLDPLGNLLVVDHGGHKIHQMTPEGNWSYLVGTGAQPGQMSLPIGLHVSQDGSFWISERSPGKLQHRTADGRWVVLGSEGSEPGQFLWPHQVVVDGSGDVWVADMLNHRVVRFTPVLPVNDTTAPTSNHSLSPSVPLSGWHASAPVTVAVSATDDTGGSGVKEIRYSVDMGSEQVVAGASATIAVVGDGIHTVAYWSVDAAGNVEETRYATVKIDTTAPAATGAISAGRLTLGAVDNASGLASIEYGVDGGPLSTYTAALNLPAGAKMVRFRTTDIAGNTSAFSTVAAVAYLKSLTLAPSSVVAGGSIVATATLAFAAPTGGLEVEMASDHPNVLAPPATLSVPAGQTKATVTLRAAAVPTDRAVTLTARLHATTLTALATVLVPEPKGLLLSPSLVTGGASSTGTVTISGPAPAGGQPVALSSLDPSVASVPATVVVPEGALSASFTIQTANPSSNRAVLIEAQIDGRAVVAVLTVRPVSVATFALSASSVIGGGSVSASVSLTRPAPAGGTVVEVSYGNAAITGPATVALAAGETSKSFTIQTTAVAADTAGFVGARVGAGLLRAPLRVLAPQLLSVSVSPATLKGGLSSTLTVRLTGPAPAAGYVVALSSSSTKASLPNAVLVPAGASEAAVPVSTGVVTASTTVTLTAARAGRLLTTRLVLQP